MFWRWICYFVLIIARLRARWFIQNAYHRCEEFLTGRREWIIHTIIALVILSLRYDFYLSFTPHVQQTGSRTRSKRGASIEVSGRIWIISQYIHLFLIALNAKIHDPLKGHVTDESHTLPRRIYHNPFLRTSSAFLYWQRRSLLNFISLILELE